MNPQYDRIADLLRRQLESDGHSLDNIPKAVFHIQAHGKDDNQSRLTYPGVELFPARGLASVGYNSFGIMAYCRNNFVIGIYIRDTNNTEHSISFDIPNTGPESVKIKLPNNETISDETGRKTGLNGIEIDRLNQGGEITKDLGSATGSLSIETALLIGTSVFYTKLNELIDQGNQFSHESQLTALISLHKRMYNLCGITTFPNCNYKDLHGFYKSIFYVFDKIYSLYPNPGENDICELITEKGTRVPLENPQPISPYGLYIMNSSLKYLYDISLKYEQPTTPFLTNVKDIIANIGGILFGSAQPQESHRTRYDEMSECIQKANVMYRGSDMAGTFVNKVPELFYKIIQLRLESELFRELIPNKEIRDEILGSWLWMADLDNRIRIKFSELQFYLSYILLMDVSIIDGSCRISSNKTSLITPTIQQNIFRSKSRKRTTKIIELRTMFQNEVANTISINTTEIINRRISDFQNGRLDPQPVIYDWINIFYKKTSPLFMTRYLKRPWFFHNPPSTRDSEWTGLITSARNPSQLKSLLMDASERERQERINEIEQELKVRIERMGDEIIPLETTQDLVVELMTITPSITPEEITDNDILKAIEKALKASTSLSIARREEAERIQNLATHQLEAATNSLHQAQLSHDPVQIEEVEKLSIEVERTAFHALEIAQEASRIQSSIEQQLKLKKHITEEIQKGSDVGRKKNVGSRSSMYKSTKNVVNTPDKRRAVTFSKVAKKRDTIATARRNSSTTKGGYRRRVTRRRRNMSKNKRKITRKQY
jgi:hypothetical protein